MFFTIDDKKFSYDLQLDSTNTIIKSYNKEYTVEYNNNKLKEIIIDTYKSGDFIFIDKNVFNLDSSCLNTIENKNIVFFDAIEENKTIESVLNITDCLMHHSFNKKNKLIVIGGGITQDVGGFASAIYKRGISWTLIPTTFLSITDSAIGGKVGVNRNSKNMLGVFMAPNKVIISSQFLSSLKEEDIISGLGEALKLCLIGGSYAFSEFNKYYMTDHMNIIKLSSSIKKSIIEYDELEKNERRVLNYGHTFGHAIESTTNYFIPHGIAVLYGMYIINRLFYDDKHFKINEQIYTMIPQKFKKINIDYDTCISHVLNDKKNNGDEICFIVLDEVGKTKIVFKKIIDINEKLQSIFNSLFN
jgi:3-dehydroquinate synthase